MATGRPSNTDSEEWFELAVQLDQNWATDKAFQASYQSGPTPTTHSNPQPGLLALPKSTLTLPPSQFAHSNLTPSNLVPMDIDAAYKVKPTPNTCCQCGKTGTLGKGLQPIFWCLPHDHRWTGISDGELHHCTRCCTFQTNWWFRRGIDPSWGFYVPQQVSHVPPLFSSNHFSVLSIHNIPEITEPMKNDEDTQPIPDKRPRPTSETPAQVEKMTGPQTCHPITWARIKLHLTSQYTSKPQTHWKKSTQMPWWIVEQLETSMMMALSNEPRCPPETCPSWS